MTRELQMRELRPGIAAKHLSVALSQMSAMQTSAKELGEPPAGLDGQAMYFDKYAKIQEMQSGVEGYVIGVCVVGFEVPPVAAQPLPVYVRGLAVHDAATAQGWTLAEIVTAYGAAMDHLSQSVAGPAIQEATELADFSASQEGSPT